jgi:hypothetical protein
MEWPWNCKDLTCLTLSSVWPSRRASRKRTEMEEAGKATSIYLLAWLPASDSQSQGNRNGSNTLRHHLSELGTFCFCFLLPVLLCIIYNSTQMWSEPSRPPNACAHQRKWVHNRSTCCIVLRMPHGAVLESGIKGCRSFSSLEKLAWNIRKE